MRAASLWVTYQKDYDTGYKICESYSEQGFIYTPIIYNCLINDWIDFNCFNVFISNCLIKCSRT